MAAALHSIPNDSREISFLFPKEEGNKGKRKLLVGRRHYRTDTHAKKKMAKKLTPCLQLIFFFYTALESGCLWLFVRDGQHTEEENWAEKGKIHVALAHIHTHDIEMRREERSLLVTHARFTAYPLSRRTNGRRRASSLRATTTCCCATTAIMCWWIRCTRRQRHPGPMVFFFSFLFKFKWPVCVPGVRPSVSWPPREKNFFFLVCCIDSSFLRILNTYISLYKPNLYCYRFHYFILNRNSFSVTKRLSITTSNKTYWKPILGNHYITFFVTIIGPSNYSRRLSRGCLVSL